MISKQDRVKPRTVEDLERKYNFGEQFARRPTNGEDGKTPFIGSNGNWWIGSTDTGVKAEVDESKFATKDEVAKGDSNIVAKIPTKTSQLTNDSKFATETHVLNAIAQAQLGGDDSDIDLSGFATKDEVLVGLEQTQKSTESGGKNVWTATFGDGATSTIEILNGAKGDKGDKGDPGIQGVQGIQGEKGAKGDKGDKGDQGIQGEKGDQGEPGAQGIQGAQGLPGAKGDKGDQGAQGIQGERGEKGDKGDPGLKGDKGDPGEQGVQGIQGIQGEKGDKGEKGEQGLQGIQGEKGDKGDKGEKGDKGDPGTPADTSQFYTKEQVAALIKEAISSLKTSDLINDSGFVTEGTVGDLINEALEGSGSGGGTAGDSGTTDGDTSNDSTMHTEGAGENRVVTYTADTTYLGTNDRLVIGELVIEANETSTENSVRFPLSFTSQTDITQIIIAVNRSCILTATAGGFDTDGYTWYWNPGSASVKAVTISCNVNARVESIRVITN